MQNFMIFGDSYSTHKEYIPDGYACYYSTDGVEGGAAVRKMSPEQTWWWRLAERTGARLLLNDSWSGSTICYTGYEGDCSTSSSFIYRHRRLCKDGFFEQNAPDTVFVFGGTNDNWAGVPLGNVMLSDWQESDLFFVLPAICHFMHSLRREHPSARIVFIGNCGLKAEILACMEQAAAHYGADYVALHDIEKSEGHPTVRGMEQICEQIVQKLGY